MWITVLVLFALFCFYMAIKRFRTTDPSNLYSNNKGINMKESPKNLPREVINCNLVLDDLSNVMSTGDIEKLKPVFIEAIYGNCPAKELVKVIGYLQLKLPIDIEIFAESLLQAYYRAKCINQGLLDAEIDHFEYVGSEMNIEPCKTHCNKRIGKVYTYAQIKGFPKNKSGLSIMLFGSGWGCFHSWEGDIFNGQ